MREIIGSDVRRWLNVELVKQETRIADLLGETADGRLVHVELQSQNESSMAVRMAEYFLAIYRKFGSFPQQAVLYVGEAPLKMPDRLDGSAMQFEYRLVDAREIDSEILLASGSLHDSVLAILGRLRDQRGAIRRMLERIDKAEPGEREIAFDRLMVLARLRRLRDMIREEALQMPITDTIRDPKWWGPEYRKGMDEGEVVGQRRLLTRQLERRFGALPAWAEGELARRSSTELDELGVRLFDVGSLDELLKA